MPAGNCGESFGTRTFLWTTGTGRRRSWSRWRSAATPMRNTGWGQLYRDGPLLIPDSRKAKALAHPGGRAGVIRLELLGKLLSLTIGRCGTRTRASAGWDKRRRAESHCCLPSGQKVSGGELAVNKGYRQAVDWFTKSAEAGKPVRPVHAGKAVPDGTGLPQDQTKAMVWKPAAPPPREISMLSSFWSRETISTRPL